MIGKMISDRLGVIINPARREVRAAQEQAFERVQQVLFSAESEVAREGRFMTPEQKLHSAEKELEKAEGHLLSALSSMYKAVCYIAPQINPFINHQPLKEVKGEVIDQSQNESSGS